MNDKNIFDNFEFIQSELSQFIKCKRIEKGLSLVALSALIDKTHAEYYNTYLCRMESNKIKITKKMFKIIINALDINSDDLNRFFVSLNQSLEYLVIKDYEENKNEVIRQVIHYMRVKQDMSVNDLGKIIELSEGTIEDIEEGYTNSRAITLVKILRGLNVSSEDYKNVKKAIVDGKLEPYVPHKYAPTIYSKSIHNIKIKNNIDSYTLARLAKIDLRMLIKIEAGKIRNPYQNTINKIYNALGVNNENIKLTLKEYE